MRIGIDCRTILYSNGSERAGVAHYSYYLVKHILEIDKNNEYVLFVSHAQLLPEEFLANNVRIIHFSKKIFPFIHSHYTVAREIKKQNLDIYHSLSGILPLFFKGKSIITIADLSMYVNPRWFSPKKFIGDFFWRKILIPQSIKKANRIIAISENTKSDLVKIFKVPESKIEVIYLGVEPPLPFLPLNKGEAEGVFMKKLNLSGKKYFLFIGTIEPRKNIINIVRAFENMVGYGRDRTLHNNFYLVLAGGLGWKYEPILDAIKNSTAREHIKYIGYVSAEEKISLLKNALCFVWPSLYEGFGLPILEAMAFGAPVITSNTSSIPEVAGSAAIVVDPSNVLAISQAMARIANNENEQKKLRQLGAQRINNFSWETAAKKTIEAYLFLGNQKIH